VSRRRPGEFEVIARYFTPPVRHTVLAGGDDAALVRVRAGCELAVSTDLLLEGRHFFRGADPRRLGHKALAVNLSDMAAMGATPCWATLAIALPRADTRWLAAFARGFIGLARRFDVDLVGGDTTRGPLAICVQIMGEVPRGAALTRAGARPGDDVWLSGRTGEAALAVALRGGRLRLAPRLHAACERRLDLPEPRVALGLALRRVASAAIDVSDGLLADLGHIAERSAVSAVVECERVPRAPAVRGCDSQTVAEAALLGGGDDYELCFTAPPRSRLRVEGIARRLRLPLTRIGRIERGTAGKVTVTRGGRAFEPPGRGFDHFG
jgi:thiamine-monophosphate kinase